MDVLEKLTSRKMTLRILRFAVPVWLWLMVLIGVARFVPLLDHQGLRIDFSIYMLSAHAFYADENPYRTNFDFEARKTGLENHYMSHATDPPTFILLFAPLSRLTPQNAFWVWTVINCAALVAAMLLLVGPGSGLSASLAWSFAALATFYPPTVSSFSDAKRRTHCKK
jgi:glycosyl transferase family 87